MRLIIAILREKAVLRYHSANSVLRTGLLDGALRARQIGRAESVSGPAWFALLLTSGRAWISGDEGQIAGPVFTWSPWTSDKRAKFAAGTTGCYAILGSSALTSAIGQIPDGREIRDVFALSVTKPLEEDEDDRNTLNFAFRGLHRELESRSPGSQAIVEAYLRVIVIVAYRARQSTFSATETMVPGHRAFRRFGELVEIHFRDRWTVNEYASALGMSRDRLGDICRRARNLGPKELIDRRVIMEARWQLENSSLSNQQIAGLLGFSSAPQFSHFFLRHVGITPGRFRKQMQESEKAEAPAAPVLYEWP